MTSVPMRLIWWLLWLDGILYLRNGGRIEQAPEWGGGCNEALRLSLPNQRVQASWRALTLLEAGASPPSKAEFGQLGSLGDWLQNSEAIKQS